MKTNLTFPPALGRALYFGVLLGLVLLLLLLVTSPARAQFSADPGQTQFVCNAANNQVGVQAFADGAGGSYVAWIDKRAGNNSGPGSALYLQRLNAAGVPQLAANGLNLFQTKGRDIFAMKVIPWQSGLLVAWVQGAFGVGGDSVRCQYYNAAGVPQWAAPTLVAARTLPEIIYESEQGLNIIPISTGATITHALALNGGSARFTFNQVSATGLLRWPLNYQQVSVSPNSIFASDYYHTVGDGADGFYLVASAGGLSSPIYAQRFGPAGVPAWAAYTTISAGGSTGRGSDWQLLTDPAGNLYVAWTSNGGDPLVSKVLPTGALDWPGAGSISLCTTVSYKVNPAVIWQNNALWMVWEDARGATGSDYRLYAQKINAAGSLAWAADGVAVYGQKTSYLRPKLAASDNGSVMAFYATDTNVANFRAQKLLPDGSLALPGDGIILHSVAVNRPYELDYVPVSQSNGAVQVYWDSPGAAPTGRDICAARVQNSGTLLSAAGPAAAAPGLEVYPNPAAGELRLRGPAGPGLAEPRLYDALGRLARTFADAGPDGHLSLRGLPAGIYVLRGELAGQPVSRRVVITR